jgi:uncharacterized protein
MTGGSGPASAAPEVAHERGPSKGRYVIRMDGAEAEMTYTLAGEKLLIIDHTSVPDALRGRKLGNALVQRGVEDARKEGRKIIPLCPFAKGLIARHPEWQDVLAG